MLLWTSPMLLPPHPMSSLLRTNMMWLKEHSLGAKSNLCDSSEAEKHTHTESTCSAFSEPLWACPKPGAPSLRVSVYSFLGTPLLPLLCTTSNFMTFPVLCSYTPVELFSILCKELKGFPGGTSVLAWKTPWTEEPGELQFMGSQRVRHKWSDLAQWAESSLT